MQESFLHFLWQFQYFIKLNLQTITGQEVQIIRNGIPNVNAGPDFSQARIVVEGVEWVGQVEIHLKTSDWNVHHHYRDAAYNNVILHVVWEHNSDIYRNDGTVIPTIELHNRVDPQLLHSYQYLLANQEVIPCASQFVSVPDIRKRQALDKSLMQRLQNKAVLVQALLEENGNDWETTAYQWLAHNLGFKVNNEPFLRLAKAVPLKTLHKHANSLLQIEALLFGQSGFMEMESTDAYIQSLQKEYQFLSHKYGLHASQMAVQEWKFSKLRPANFPTLRIAQLAALLHTHRHLFSSLIQFTTPAEAIQWLQVKPSGFWQNHYTFDKASASPVSLGKDSTENLIINTLIPLLSCYAIRKDDQSFVEKAIALLEALPAEDNRITRIWKTLGLSVKNAFDAQASIELYNHFCTQKKCLSCPVGVSLLKPSQLS
jgi:hypothetical protein